MIHPLRYLIFIPKKKRKKETNEFGILLRNNVYKHLRKYLRKYFPPIPRKADWKNRGSQQFWNNPPTTFSIISIIYGGDDSHEHR